MNNASEFYVISDLENPSIDEDEDDAPFIEIHEELLTNPVRGWHSGHRLQDPPTSAIQIEATPHFGYQGPPPDYYDGSISLMSPRLVEVLRTVGVDNLDLYPAIVTYRGTGEQYEFYAFNLLGLVQAVDVSASNISNEDGDFLIDSSIEGFTVNPSTARGFYMFRLVENVMTVVVSSNVKKAVDAAKINTFAFKDPGDWIVL